jgi:hypothetical protein
MIASRFTFLLEVIVVGFYQFGELLPHYLFFLLLEMGLLGCALIGGSIRRDVLWSTSTQNVTLTVSATFGQICSCQKLVLATGSGVSLVISTPFFIGEKEKV